MSHKKSLSKRKLFGFSQDEIRIGFFYIQPPESLIRVIILLAYAVTLSGFLNWLAPSLAASHPNIAGALFFLLWAAPVLLFFKIFDKSYNHSVVVSNKGLHFYKRSEDHYKLCNYEFIPYDRIAKIVIRRFFIRKFLGRCHGRYNRGHTKFEIKLKNGRRLTYCILRNASPKFERTRDYLLKKQYECHSSGHQ